MFMYIYIWLHVFKQIVYSYIYLHVCIGTHIYNYVCLYTCTFIYMCLNSISIRTHIYMCLNICKYKYWYKLINMFVVLFQHICVLHMILYNV